MHRTSLAAAAALTLAVAAGPPARAEPPPLPPADPRVVLNVITENDAYVPHSTDRWYTNGLRLGWLSPEGALPSPVAWLDERLGELFGPARTRWGMAIGQTIFTPVNKVLVNPDPSDRPYAGALFLEFGINRRTANTLDRFMVQAGVLGPSSLARQSQDFVHSILAIPSPRGWGAQLHDEPILTFFWDRTWRVPLIQAPSVEAPGIDVLPNAGIALGNAQVNAGVGLRLRVGQGLDQDFGPPRIRPAFSPAPGPAGDEFGWYFFGGVGGRAVGHDITLNGNTWRDSPSVAPRHLVGEAEIGLAVFWRGIRLSYTHVWRTKEFVAQPVPFRFGSIAVSFAF